LDAPFRGHDSQEWSRNAAVIFAATTSFTAPIQPVWVRSNTMPSDSLVISPR